jgi:hypothetical protein
MFLVMDTNQDASQKRDLRVTKKTTLRAARTDPAPRKGHLLGLAGAR